MPHVRIVEIVWGLNTLHATRRASASEIEEVFASRPVIRGNRRQRTATHIAVGRTAAGRSLTVAFIYVRVSNAAIPVTAWENR
jgi:hypothetical protein